MLKQLFFIDIFTDNRRIKEELELINPHIESNISMYILCDAKCTICISECDFMNPNNRIVRYLFVLVLLVLPVELFAQLAGFEYRKKFTIDNTLVSGSTDLTNFPVLISLTDADLATVANSGYVTNGNGYDIAFTSSDGSTQMDHELEEYTASTGEILVWVRFPTLSATVDTDFYIYFGNSSISTDQSTSSTWNSNYQLVLHMDDLSDATSNANNATNNGTTSTTGKLGNARNFSSAGSDFLSVADDATLDITQDITISAWVNADNFGTTPDLVTKGDWDESYATWVRADNTLRLADDGTTIVTSSGTISSSTTAYVTFTNSASGSAIYINGSPSGTGSAGTFTNNNNPLTVSSSAYPINGWIDEVRVSNTPHTADWIATEYNNQNSPGTFYSESNEPPVLSAIEVTPLSIVAGGAATIITETIALSTPFADSIESATIQITTNYDSSEDVLAFTDTGLISGSWASGSGILTLSGRASVADYQAALRSVTYQNTDGSSPDLSSRTVSFSVDDVFYTSNTETRDIYVTQVYSDLSTDITNVVFHYDAQDVDGDLDTGDQPVDGSSVSLWGDRSNEANSNPDDIEASAPTGDEPTFDSDYFGERGGLFFDYNSGDNGDNFQMQDSATVNTSNFNEKSFAVVFRTGDDVSGLQIIYEQGGGSNGYQISIKDGTLYAYAWSTNGSWTDGDDISIDLGSVETNESYIVIANHDQSRTAWEAKVNDGAIVLDPNTAGTMNSHGGDPTIGEEDGTNDPVTFASNPSTTNNFNGYIGELVSWNTALSAGQIAGIYTYLCDKWCNEAPVLSAIEGTDLDFTEGDSPTTITSSIVITDNDNTQLDSAKVVISANYVSTEDVLDFSDTGSITGSWDSSTGTITLVGTTSIANYQTALHSVTFENTNTVNPSTSVRQIDFYVYDWDDSSNVVSRDINIIAVNSTPSLSGVTGSTVAYTEGDGTTTIPTSVTITDVDDTNIESATITVSNNYFNGEDILSFVDTGSITSSFDEITGVLTLTGTASLADYETALENILYENTSSDPIELTRTISFRVNDGDNNSNTQTRDISVTATNSPPVLSNIEAGDLAYPDAEIEITNTIEVTDPDDTTIDSALVLITGNFQASEDSLIYSTLFGISGSYNASTGKLVLTGTSSFSDYQTALRSVKYKNYGTVPSGPEREISFLAYDDDGAESDTVKRTLEVNPIESISGLTVWLRSDVGVTTSGSEVTTWQDQSGNGYDYTGVADAGTRPTFVSSSSALGGQPAIEFAGNGDHFEDSDGDTDYLNGLTEFTLFLVYKSDATNTDRGLWIADTPSGADEIFTIRYDASGANTGGSFTNAVKTGILGNSAANQLESFSDIQTTNAQITSLHWDSGVTYDLYVDGILNNPAAAGAPPTGTISSATTAIVGKGGKDDPSSANQSWDGLIAEVILYGRYLGDTERESVEDYLSQKYSSAIRKITPATGGSAISADDANTTYTSLTGPTIQEGQAGELTNSGTIILTAPTGYEWNTGSSPSLSVSPVYGGSTSLTATFTSITTDEATFTITAESATNPAQIEFSGLEVRPTTGVIPNTGNITNTGTTGQGGGTNYGSLTMVPGASDSLSFVQQPSITNVDSVITPSVRVQLVDQFGNSVKSSGVNVSIAKASGSGALTGTSPVSTNVLGIAEFSDLVLDDVGNYTLAASSAGLSSDTSSTFEIVNAGTLTGFTVKRFPSGNISAKQAGQTFNIVLTAIDGTGTTVTTFNGTVSITSSCTMGTGQGTTANFSSGVLSSHTVSITSVGNCTITATNSAGSQNGVSNTFTVSPGTSSAATTTISASPKIILNNGSSTSTITVQLKDAFGNNLTSSGKTVGLSTTAGSLSAVTDNGNGTFSATLTSSTSVETATITGTLGPDAITDDAEVEFAAFTHIWTSQLGSPSTASDWDDTGNWNVGTLPTSSSVVLIPLNPSDGNEFPVVDVTNTTVAELAFETDAELSVSGSINFVVTGDITGEGSILGSNNDSLTVGGDLDVADITLGNVILDGASEQEIVSPNSFVDLEIDNSTTVNISENLTVTGTLTLTDGELLIPSGINLISTDQSYGSGELRFQRRITGSRGWRMISSPVSSTYGDFLDGMLTQGYSGAFYSTGSNPGDTLQPNILTYLEDYPGTDNQRYRAPTSSAQSLTEGQGIWAFFFGNIAADSRYNDPLPDTLDVSGQEFNGNGTEVDFGVTYTTTADSGWNFVGNPFGATINWNDASNWTKTNIESTIYIWDPAANSGNGEYLTWNGTTGTLGSGRIAPFQGFWVKANATSPSLKVKLDAKTTGGNFLRKETRSAEPVIELEAQLNGLSKRTNIMFSDEGSRQRDSKDGLRLVPFSTNHVEFYSLLNDRTQLAINNQPLDFQNRIEIPLVVRAFTDGNPESGTFIIRKNSMRNIPADWKILLLDHQTGATIDLTNENEYVVFHSTNSKLIANKSPLSPDFKFKVKENTASARFTLRITTEEIESRIPDDFYLEQNYPNPFNPSTTIQYGLVAPSRVKLEVFDVIGRKIQTLVNQEQFEGNYSVTFDAGNLASGVYIYRITTNQGVRTKRLTLIK